MKEIWQSILKFILGKTKVDEIVADKVEDLKEQIDIIDQIDNDTETK